MPCPVWTEELLVDGRLMIYRDGQPYVYVHKSRAIAEGEGLFAAKMFLKDETIAMYDGVEIEASVTGVDSAYVAQIRKAGKLVCVDGKNIGAPYPQKINAPYKTLFKSNAVMKNTGRIRAKRILIERDEILMTYGRSYWSHHSSIIKNIISQNTILK